MAGTGQDLTSTFAYNPASQVTVRTRSNDAFVPAETPASKAYAVNGLNQYTAVAGAAYAYDSNGNLTSDGPTAYTYDAENRLVGASGAKTATLAYDPLGRLAETSGAAGANLTRYLYDGDELVVEYNSAGTILRRYVHGAAVDDPLIWYEGSGTLAAARRHLFADHQGSVVSLADSTGAALGINHYDDWGLPQATNQGRFQYTGQAWIPELALYHYKARAYSPILGRFMQTDPVGYVDQVNLYAYAANDPVNNVDPAGETGYYVSRAAGGTGGGADHGFVVVADYPGGPIKGIYSYTDIGGTLRSSANDISQDSTLRTDVSVWNSLDTSVAKEIGATFNIIDATDASIFKAGNAVDASLQSGDVGYSALPAMTPSGCNSNCGAAAVANIAREDSGNSGEHPAPDDSRWAPGREQSERIEVRLGPK